MSHVLAEGAGSRKGVEEMGVGRPGVLGRSGARVPPCESWPQGRREGQPLGGEVRKGVGGRESQMRMD